MGGVLHEDQVDRTEYSDRWSKDLIGGEVLRTTSGFSIGVAEYHTQEFGELQIHEDQEAVYVVSGVGEIRIGERVYGIRPGSSAYIPPKAAHATRRTGDEPVKVVYAHGAV